MRPLTPAEIDHLWELLHSFISGLSRAEFEEVLSHPKPPISSIELVRDRVEVKLTTGFVSMARIDLAPKPANPSR